MPPSTGQLATGDHGSFLLFFSFWMVQKVIECLSIAGAQGNGGWRCVTFEQSTEAVTGEETASFAPTAVSSFWLKDEGPTHWLWCKPIQMLNAREGKESGAAWLTIELKRVTATDHRRTLSWYLLSQNQWDRLFIFRHGYSWSFALQPEIRALMENIGLFWTQHLYLSIVICNN